MDLDLAQIHPRFETSKSPNFKFTHTRWNLQNPPACFYILLQADAFFYVLLQAKTKITIDPSAQVCLSQLISSS